MTELAATGLMPRGEGLRPRRALVLAVVVSVVALTLAVPLRAYFSQRAEYDQLSTQNSQLGREVVDLQKRVALQDDPAYVQQQARNRLQFVMPGDRPFTMQYPAPPPLTDEQKRQQRDAAHPWYANLWSSIGNPVHG